MKTTDRAIKGVNLGGWLVLEKWLTPSLFEGSQAIDEYTLCRDGSPQILKRLAKHRRTFITAKDFVWLKKQGITAVRIPVGHWVFGDAEPYQSTVAYLDKAFDWAQANGIDILLCLHGAPGSQNGEMHSGKQGAVQWDKDPKNVAQTLQIITKLASRYRTSPSLWGIELLNEPAASLSRHVLVRYYHQAYQHIRQICGQNVRVVINDIWAPKRWRWAMHWPKYKNVWFDTHQYQVFSERERTMVVDEHIAYTRRTVIKQLQKFRRHHHTIVGEWSMALDPLSLRAVNPANKQQAYMDYYRVQQATYGQMDGWFYWTYKTENGGPWDFRRTL